MTVATGTTRDLLAEAARRRAEGRDDEAEALWREVLRRAPGHPAAHAELAGLAFGRGDASGAADHYEAACQARPDHAGLQFNLGVALRRCGRNDEAAIAFRRALTVSPADPGPARALVQALMADGHRFDRDLERALAIDPVDPEGWYNLGVTRVEADRLAEAAEAYRRHGRLVRGRPLDAPTSDPFPELPAEPVRPVSRQCCSHRLRHDRDQLRWLERNGMLPAALAGEADRYQQVLDGLTDAERDAVSFELSEAAFARIARSYNRLTRLAASGWTDGPALNDELDWPALEQAFLESSPRCLTIDSLLRPASLDALRRYCRGSTIWHQIKGAGYLGAYFRECFNDPLVVRIAEDLRERLPRVLGSLPARVIWAYSYDQEMAGINPHADFAGINLNFWITEDEANLDPGTGGLKVYRKAAPAEWDFRTYNSASAEFIYDYLGDDRDDMIRIPHRANRAAMFDSRLIHETDTFRFRPGFANRRINITMLFGDGG